MQHGRNFCCRYLPAFLCAVPLQEKTDTNFKKESFSEKEPEFFYSKNNESPKNFAARDTSPSKTTSIPQFASPPASTFRKRRLSKAHHNHTQEEEDKQISSSAANIQQRDRDTFLYAAEIEGLVEEHPLQTPHSHFSSAHSITLPFSDRSVGAYSCHGVEPFSLRRYVTGAELQVYNIHPDAHLPVVRKINQDRGAIAHPYGNDKNTALFSVFDGHGEFGDHVAEYAMIQTLSKLKNHPGFKTDLTAAFQEVFLEIDADLEKSASRKSKFSGCTACVALIREKTLYVANVGDSRAVLARRNNAVGRNDSAEQCFKKSQPFSKDYTTIKLTFDQHPALPEERTRIECCGGHISFSEGADHGRVWLDANHSVYGLAMSRSIGDLCMKSVGVTAESILTTHLLQEDDEFLILATDGVWGVLNSSEAVALVGGLLDSDKGASVACEVLIETAMEKWREYEGDYRDDITAIVVRVKDLWKKYN